MAPLRRLPRVVAAASAVTLLVAACSRSTSPVPRGGASSPTPSTASFPISLTDDDGVSVTLDAAPKRIVTFGPSDTEILFALGLGDEVVGVCCEFDDFPPEAKDLPHVEGEGQQPNAETVISLQPDLMLNAFPGADAWAGPIRDAGIPVFTTTATGFDDALADIRTIGKLTGSGDAAARVTADMEAQANDIAAKVEAAGRVTCFLDLGGFYTVGPNDFVFDILRRAGCDPISASATTSFPQWSKEQLVHDDPAVFLFTDDSGETADAIESDPALKELTAVKEGRVVSVDGDLVSRPGPRLAEGLLELAKALHPDAFGA